MHKLVEYRSTLHMDKKKLSGPFSWQPFHISQQSDDQKAKVQSIKSIRSVQGVTKADGQSMNVKCAYVGYPFIDVGFLRSAGTCLLNASALASLRFANYVTRDSYDMAMDCN